MMISILRFGRLAAISSLVFLIGHSAHAQQKTPIPSFTGERVIVAGVPDRYRRRWPARSRGWRRHRRSRITSSSSSRPAQADSATRNYADELVRQRGATQRTEARPVVRLRPVGDHRGGTRKPAGRRQSPARSFAINSACTPSGSRRDLIPRHLSRWRERTGIPRRSPALLDDDQQLDRGARQRYAVYRRPGCRHQRRPVRRSKTATDDLEGTGWFAGEPLKPNRRRPTVRVVTTEPAPLKQASSEWLPVIIVAVPVGLMVLAFVFWIWHLYRRAQGRVAGRIKEIKSKAADVMDRLDGLKERLKLMPTSTEFKQPMTGETQALYGAVNEKLGKLWDGWLQVMDVLEKAQKLAARSGSPLSQKTLAEAEELITKQGSFAEIETQAQAIAADVDRLEHAHQAARTVLEAVTAARPKIDAGLDGRQEAGPADGALSGRAECRHRRD